MGEARKEEDQNLVACRRVSLEGLEVEREVERDKRKMHSREEEKGGRLRACWRGLRF